MIALMNAPTPPPMMPSDTALLSALSLLSAIGNPGNAKTMLDAMAQHKQEIDASIAEHAAERKRLEDATAALAGVQAQADDVAAREKAIADSQLQLRVASSAVQDRDRALDLRSASLDQREQQLAAREKAHLDKVASMKAALSA
jgi:uncharacterized protein (DUF3084 family)